MFAVLSQGAGGISDAQMQAAWIQQLYEEMSNALFTKQNFNASAAQNLIDNVFQLGWTVGGAMDYLAKHPITPEQAQDYKLREYLQNAEAQTRTSREQFMNLPPEVLLNLQHPAGALTALKLAQFFTKFQWLKNYAPACYGKHGAGAWLGEPPNNAGFLKIANHYLKTANYDVETAFNQYFYNVFLTITSGGVTKEQLIEMMSGLNPAQLDPMLRNLGIDKGWDGELKTADGKALMGMINKTMTAGNPDDFTILVTVDIGGSQNTVLFGPLILSWRRRDNKDYVINKFAQEIDTALGMQGITQEQLKNTVVVGEGTLKQQMEAEELHQPVNEMMIGEGVVMKNSLADFLVKGIQLAMWAVGGVVLPADNEGLLRFFDLDNNAKKIVFQTLYQCRIRSANNDCNLDELIIALNAFNERHNNAYTGNILGLMQMWSETPDPARLDRIAGDVVELVGLTHWTAAAATTAAETVQYALNKAWEVYPDQEIPAYNAALVALNEVGCLDVNAPCDIKVSDANSKARLDNAITRQRQHPNRLVVTAVNNKLQPWNFAGGKKGIRKSKRSRHKRMRSSRRHKRMRSSRRHKRVRSSRRHKRMRSSGRHKRSRHKLKRTSECI